MPAFVQARVTKVYPFSWKTGLLVASILDETGTALVRLIPSLDLMMSSGKLCFRKPNKTLGLTNFFSAKTAPNSKRVRCAVYKRLRENGASWAKQLNDSTPGSFGEGGGGGGGGKEKNSFCPLNDCWWLLYCTSLHLMGNKNNNKNKKKKQVIC